MLSCLYPRFIFESAVMFVYIDTGKEYFCGSENTLTIVLVMKLVYGFVVGSRAKYINTHTHSLVSVKRWWKSQADPWIVSMSESRL